MLPAHRITINRNSNLSEPEPLRISEQFDGKELDRHAVTTQEANSQSLHPFDMANLDSESPGGSHKWYNPSKLDKQNTQQTGSRGMDPDYVVTEARDSKALEDGQRVNDAHLVVPSNSDNMNTNFNSTVETSIGLHERSTPSHYSKTTRNISPLPNADTSSMAAKRISDSGIPVAVPYRLAPGFVATSPSELGFSTSGVPLSRANSTHRRLSSEFTDLPETVEPTGPSIARKQPSRFWGRDPQPGEVDVGQELGDHAAIWEKYCAEAQEHDRVMTEGWNGDMDVLLVFAALFSAILTAFIIEFYKQLQPDNLSLSVALLTNMAVTLECLANGTTCTNLPGLPSGNFQSPGNFKWINGLWFTSLTLSVSVSAVAILVKQWIHAYHSGLTGLPKTYARIRQFRYNGIKKWHMSGIINALPSVLYLAVLLFFAGLLVLLFSLDLVIYNICVAIVVATGTGYVTTTALPVMDPSCPFRTPVSQFLDRILQVTSYHMTRLWHLCICGLLATLGPVWNHLIWSSDEWIRSIGRQLFRMHKDAKLSLRQSLKMTLQAERERERIVTQIPELNAQALVWLSSTHVQDTQEFVVQAIAGLNCKIAVTQFNKPFNGSQWSALSLVEAFNNPNRSSGYYHKLASCAQAYLITSQLNSEWELNIDETQIVCNALQWYPVLVPMGQQAGPSAVPDECLPQAIRELGQALSIVTHTVIENDCFEIVVDLLLYSVLTLYVLYSDNTTVQRQILESCFETLQIWMREQAVLEQWPRPPFLRSLCTILQVFSGITQADALRSIWSNDKQDKETWMLLLKSLLSLPSDEDETQGEIQEFRNWRLLNHALQDCSRLLSEDRTTLNLVLDAFLKTSPNGKELWVSDTGTKHPFHCLHLIGPLLTPDDTFQITQSFERPWTRLTGFQLCKFLQARCRDPDQCRIVANSKVLDWLLEYLEYSGDFAAMWVICILLQTLSKMAASDFEPVHHYQVLHSVNVALSMKIEEGLETWSYYQHWGVPFSLAITCYRVYRLHEQYILSSGIVATLNHLSLFASVSEFADMKETQNFIHSVLKLVEREKLYGPD